VDGGRREPLTPVAIPGELLAAVYAHAIAAFPDECCGYLVGATPDAVDAVVACRNAQADGSHPIAPERGADTGFVIDGAELFAFARSFDGARPPRVVYHSHTNGSAYFSTVDRRMAGSEGGPSYPVQHLVIGAAPGAVTEVAQFAWSAAAGDFVEIARWRAEPPR
jgi:proteasome lid subunit RPN8/RPN11